MSKIENLKKSLVEFRNKVKYSLNDNELGQIDTYIDTLIKDLQPAYDIIDNLEGDKEQLEVLKDEVENMIKEEKWLEKLSKIS